MKYSGTLYEVKNLDGNSGLSLLPYEQEGIEGAKHAICRANESARKNGYAERQYLIVRVKWSRYTDEEGEFVRARREELVVDKYPYTAE